MNAQDFYFAGFFTLALFLGAISERFRTVSVIYAVALLALYPNTDQVTFVTLFLLPALLVAGFRE